MKNKVFAYYIEIYHKKIESAYIIQSKFYESINQANEFARQLTYLDSELGVDLMVCLGEEDCYDIHKLGQYHEIPLEHIKLKITNYELYREIQNYAR